jgi:hypothetical protein
MLAEGIPCEGRRSRAVGQNLLELLPVPMRPAALHDEISFKTKLTLSTKYKARELAARTARQRTDSRVIALRSGSSVTVDQCSASAEPIATLRPAFKQEKSNKKRATIPDETTKHRAIRSVSVGSNIRD